MELKLAPADKKRIEQSIRQKYTEVASSPQGHFNYPTGRAGLEALAYDAERIEALTDNIVASYCGVGNPFTLTSISKGEAVLDIVRAQGQDITTHTGIGTATPGGGTGGHGGGVMGREEDTGGMNPTHIMGRFITDAIRQLRRTKWRC